MGNKIRMGLCLALAFIFNSSIAADAPGSRAEVFGKAWFNPARQTILIEQALHKYYTVKEKGGWPKIKTPKKIYMKGQNDPAIRQLKARLHASGDLASSDTSAIYTDELVAAVQQVQKRFGYEATGVVDKHLVSLLNVPVEDRIHQLEVNMERFRNSKPIQEGTRIVANIPEFRLYVYEGTTPVFDMAIVVGSSSTKTVIFDDEMTHVVLSPYWNVPPSIVRNEILPAMRRSSTYLKRNNYEQTGTENGLPVIRQKPGPGNSLGLVKFIFPNDHNIYLHDTPAKGLFQYPKRTFSHGCIRLEEPAKLANYLLRHDANWSEEKIRKAMNGGREQWVKLETPVPVSLTYYTAWVDDEGLVHLRQDVYGHDKTYKMVAKTR